MNEDNSTLVRCTNCDEVRAVYKHEVGDTHALCSGTFDPAGAVAWLARYTLRAGSDDPAHIKECIVTASSFAEAHAIIVAKKANGIRLLRPALGGDPT